MKPTLSALRISEPVTSNRFNWAVPLFVLAATGAATVVELAPVAGEDGLVTVSARDPRPAAAPVGGQDLAQQAAAQAQQPGPDHLLCGPQACIAAAQDPGRLAGQPP